MNKLAIGTVLLSILILLAGCSYLGNESTQPSAPYSETSETTRSAKPTPQVLKVKPEMLSDVKKVNLTLDNDLTFTISIYPQTAPNTVKNFLEKFQSGYYHSLIFHRVEDWVVQGGDPKGDGSGGGKIPTELNDQKFTKGALGVARAADIKESNDSQFFIVTKDSEFLNENYTHFGQVTAGMENVLKIKVGDKIKSTQIIS